MTRMSSAKVATGAMPGVTRGVAFATVSVLSAPVIDIFSKLAVTAIPPTEIAALRFVVQASLMLPFLLLQTGPMVARTGWNWRMQGFHAMRGALLTISMVSFVTTLSVMEVADAIAIFFVEPIILTVLSALFLKEKVGWRRYLACAVGFTGALLVIQPSFQEVGFIALLPVVTAFAVAIFAILTRMQAQRENPFSMQFQTGLWGLAFSLLVILGTRLANMEGTALVWPDMTHFGFMLGAGAAATFTGITSVFAYRYAPASTLAPLQYLEIVSATALGWLVFSHFPDGLKWVGIAIIIASGLYIIWRERRVNAHIVTATQETPTP